MSHHQVATGCGSLALGVFLMVQVGGAVGFAVGLAIGGFGLSLLVYPKQ